MYKSLKQISVLKCSTNDVLRLSPRTSLYIQISRRKSGLKEKKAEPLISINDELSFTSFLQHRQEQAQRSFVVRVPGPEVSPGLMKLCRNFGQIKNIFHYKYRTMDYLLIEMEKKSQLTSFLKSNLGIHQNSLYQNHFLQLNSNLRLDTSETDSECSEKKKNSSSEKIIKCEGLHSTNKLDKVLYEKYESLSDLILSSYEVLKINDLEIRLRFLMCRQIEVLCSGFLPNVTAYPFGSSITGLGLNNCDLDVSLVPHVKNGDFTFLQQDYLSFRIDKVRIHLDSLSGIMKCFMPGCSNFYFVRHARVPILKFRSLFTNVECDLSLYNIHGVAMSNILYTLGSLDLRIRALVVFIKLWAQKVGMVLKGPSTTISNFSLCLLVIFFLQQLKIMPPWKIFLCQEKRLLFEDINLSQLNSFLLNENTIPKNDKSVEELFKLFFEYYEKFEFDKWGINLKTGEQIKKVHNDPLYIDNPLLPGVNVSKNVNSTSVKYIKDIISNAARILSVEKDKNKLKRLLNLTFGQPDRINIHKIL